MSLPDLNAGLNTVSAILLMAGYHFIRKDKPVIHKRYMISALIASAAFLASYLLYHSTAGSVPYPKHDWTRPLYFSILIPHIVLAGSMTPFILLAVYRAFRKEFTRHKRITRFLFPVWMFVSVSGVIVYLMLYRLN